MTAVFRASGHLRIYRPGDAPWKDRAACREADPDLFFPEEGHAATAKAVCRACPVREQCLLASISGPVKEWGVWGGFAERDRIKVARQYRAGRSVARIIAEDDERHYARLEARAA